MKYLLTSGLFIAIGFLAGCGTLGNGQLDNPVEQVPENFRAKLLKQVFAQVASKNPGVTPYLPDLYAAVDRAYAEYDTSKDILISVLNSISAIVATDARIHDLLIQKVADVFGVEIAREA